MTPSKNPAHIGPDWLLFVAALMFALVIAKFLSQHIESMLSEVMDAISYCKIGATHDC